MLTLSASQTWKARLLERLSGGPPEGVDQRISSPETFAQFYLVPKFLFGCAAACGLVLALYSAPRHRWAQLAAGVVAFVGSCVAMLRVDSPMWDVWLRGDTLILARREARVEVPLDRVASIETVMENRKMPIFVLTWTDAPRVTRMCRFAAPESPAWRSLRDRLSARVPPVRFL